MKNELIKIETREGFGRCVSLRALHEGLGVKSKFNDFAKRMCGYGFEENIDFILVTQKKVTNNPKNPFTEQTDYIITIDMAKEICMIQRSDIGREFRKYFIECEKQLKEVVQKPLLSKEDELLISIAKATTKETQMIAVGEYGRYKEEQIREKIRQKKSPRFRGLLNWGFTKVVLRVAANLCSGKRAKLECGLVLSFSFPLWWKGNPNLLKTMGSFTLSRTRLRAGRLLQLGFRFSQANV